MSGLATGLGAAFGALIVAALVSRISRGNRLPAIVPLAFGYALGPGGFGWLTEERTGSAVPLALMLGAGWAAFSAASSAADTFRRSSSRSGISWAAAFAVVAPSCLAGGLAPVILSVLGPSGLSLPALVLVVGAAILADPSPFRSKTAAAIPSHRLREAVRSADAFHACALLAWPAYWAMARALSTGADMGPDAVVASVALSFGMGIGLGILGMLLLRSISAGLLVAAVILIVVVAGAVVSSLLAVSSVGTCFIAAALMAQNQQQRKGLFNVAHNLEAPFRTLFLAAAGAAAPRWSGLWAPALILGVVLFGRMILGFVMDGLASASSGAASGRRFGWLVTVPSTLSAAMIVEGSLLLAAKGAPFESAAADGAGGHVLSWQAGSLSPVPPFLLALALGSLFGRSVLKRRMTALGPKW